MRFWTSCSPRMTGKPCQGQWLGINVSMMQRVTCGDCFATFVAHHMAVTRKSLKTTCWLVGESGIQSRNVAHQLALDKSQKAQGVFKQSRQSAWISHCEQVRAEIGSGLPSCLVLNSGHCIAVWFDGLWRVAIVLSIWRIYKKGSGAQPFSQEIGRGGVHSAWVLLASHASVCGQCSLSRCGNFFYLSWRDSTMTAWIARGHQML